MGGDLRPASRRRVGVYGLHLPDLEDASELLVEAPDHWPEWRIDLARGAGAPSVVVETSRARLRCSPSGWVDVDLARRTSTLHLPEAPARAHIAHPFLGSTAVVAAHWRKLLSFHAGAFVAGQRAWAILGERGAGKSSLLAALAQAGAPILTDDLLVVGEELQGMVGPRCIDLRAKTASALEVGNSLGVVGTRERWRLPLELPVAPEVPIAGWIRLEWGESEILEVSPRDRLYALYENIGLKVAQEDSRVLSRLMDLLVLPTFTVRRPRRVADLAATASRVLDLVERRHDC